MKSSLVEEAANELINMLLESDNNQKVEGEKKEEVESSAECEGMSKLEVTGGMDELVKPQMELLPLFNHVALLKILC